MGMLDRYKKKGGFVQLVQLIETTAKPKQEQFLQMIKNEDPRWEEAVKKHALTIEKVFSWSPETLAEVFSRMNTLTTAVVLHGLDPKFVETCLASFSHGDRRKIQDVAESKTITPAEKTTCNFKMLTEVRGFIQQGILKLEKIDPEMIIPEDYEEKLSAGPSIDLSKTEVMENVTPITKLDTSEKPTAPNKEEVEFLKKKVNALIAENTQLKQELNVARGKLDQIKKIA